MKMHITSTSDQETRRLGERLGRHCKGGEVIELISDLGGGKTTLVQGLAKGMGSPDHVASPTFTISRVYKGRGLEMHHFDFYRLQDAGLMEYELHDVLNDPTTVVVVEWGDVVAHVLPKERVTIRLSHMGEEKRGLEITCPKSLTYLMEEV
jgi:tRNA threonylcarbamoyladenosine biosynthesis protein TsaE